MENTEIANPVSKPQFVNYQLCPWWTLEHFKAQPISITGKVVSTYQNCIILEMDSIHKKEIKVEVKPFELKYTYSDEQFRKLKKLKQYHKLHRILDGAQDLQQEQDSISSPENILAQNPMEAEPQAEKQQIQTEDQTPKMITGKYFKVGTFIQVRGRCVQPRELLMQQFTILDKNLDLKAHNEMLQIITAKLQSLYY